jgi:outer membrane receptor for ferrienterochelin and colicins
MWRLARYTLAVMVSLVVLRPAAVLCQSLDDLSLADLMKLDAGQVYGAAERMQPVTEAPASVSFITADEIAQFGYRTLADVLRAVRGMYVTDDRNFSLLGTRGFGKPGDYNSRILLLINGHRFNDNVFGQAEIGSELGIDAAMFERVEIIRGPASSLYGDSAFFAVVNVITRSGASLKGGAVTVEAGTLGTRLVRVTTGHREHDVDLAVSGTFESSEGVNRLYFPVFDTPATNNGYAEGLDGERVGQFYSRLSFKGLTITGAYGSRRRDVPTASFGTIFNYQDDPERTTDRHTLVDAEYVRLVGSTRVTMRGAYDRFSYDGVYPTAVPDETTPNIKTNFVVGARWSASAGATHALPGNQTLRAGVEFIDNLRQDHWGFESGTLALDVKASSTQHAVYAQDEIRPSKWLLVTAGLRYDGYEEFSRVSPRAAVILIPSASASIKYLYGNAFRAPSQYEGTTFFFGDRVRALRPETIDTHELVWERYTNDWLRTSVSAYWYKADQLITAIADESTYLQVSFENENEVHAKGLEFEAQMRLKGRVQAWANYAVQTATERNTESVLPNSPQHIGKLRVSVPGPAKSSSIAIEGWLVSSRRTLAGSDVGIASSVNVSLLQPLGTRFELFATVRNLLDRRYEDPVSAQHQQDAIPQNPRTARVGVRVKLWD